MPVSGKNPVVQLEFPNGGVGFCRPVIPVVVRQSHRRRAAQENIIHAPRVHAEAACIFARRLQAGGSQAQADLQLLENLCDVPALRPVQEDRLVWKAMDFFNGQQAAAQAAQDDTPAFRPQVAGDVAMISHDKLSWSAFMANLHALPALSGADVHRDGYKSGLRSPPTENSARRRPARRKGFGRLCPPFE